MEIILNTFDNYIYIYLSIILNSFFNEILFTYSNTFSKYSLQPRYVIMRRYNTR